MLKHSLSKKRMVVYDDTVDDTIIVIFKDDTFVINHNNALYCRCMFCTGFQKAIINASDRYKADGNSYKTTERAINDAR